MLEKKVGAGQTWCVGGKGGGGGGDRNGVNG